MTDVRMEWGKFYWSDWDGDTALAMCSIGAQGLWMRMLCIMSRANRPGHLADGDRPMSLEQLAFMVRLPEQTVIELANELEKRGVFSRADDGTIYSRRMVRDFAEYTQFVEWGKQGGKPRKQQLNQPQNPPVKPLGKTPPYNPPLKGEGETPPSTHKKRKEEIRQEADAEALAYASAVESTGQDAREPSDARRTASAGAYAAGRAGGSRAVAPAANGKRYPKPNADPNVTPNGKHAWGKILVVCREDRIWSNELGPPPGDPHCYVPPDLLLPGDGLGWADMTPKPEDRKRR